MDDVTDGNSQFPSLCEDVTRESGPDVMVALDEEAVASDCAVAGVGHVKQ